MLTRKFAIALTVLNFLLLLLVLAQLHPVTAQDVAPVLRGRSLEIVDVQNRVRAEIKILPADPSLKMPDGSVGYPETVLLRLIDSGGGPNVKLSALEDGAGLVLGGDSGYLQLLSRRENPFVKIVTKDGLEQMVGAPDRTRK